MNVRQLCKAGLGPANDCFVGVFFLTDGSQTGLYLARLLVPEGPKRVVWPLKQLERRFIKEHGYDRCSHSWVCSLHRRRAGPRLVV